MDKPLNNYQWNLLPADVWRIIISYLSYPDKVKFYRVRKSFYTLFDEEKMIREAHMFLVKQGIDSTAVFKLFGLQRLIPNHNLILSQEELDKIDGMMKQRKMSPNLLRRLYLHMLRRDKKYINSSIVGKFYDSSVDFQYRKILLKNRSLISFTNELSHDTLELYFNENSEEFIYRVLSSDNANAFELFCSHSVENPKIVPGEINEIGLLAYLNCRPCWNFNTNILRLMEKGIQKHLWFYPRIFTQTEKFTEFFNSSLTAIDVVIGESPLFYGRNKTNFISWLESRNYTQFEFTDLGRHWTVFTRKPEMNLWR